MTMVTVAIKCLMKNIMATIMAGNESNSRHIVYTQNPVNHGAGVLGDSL